MNIMTVNNLQNQTLSVVGVHIEAQCFSYGQFYVAFSRVFDPPYSYVFAPGGTSTNVLYHKALVK